MYRFFSLYVCFRFLISQAFIPSVLMDLADHSQLSCSISICSLQHLIAKSLLYCGKSLHYASHNTSHCVAQYAFKKLIKNVHSSLLCQNN